MDFVVDIHEGRDTISVHAKFLLNPVSGMNDWMAVIHDGFDGTSDQAKSLLKPGRATRFCVAFTQVETEPLELGIVGLSFKSL